MTRDSTPIPAAGQLVVAGDLALTAAADTILGVTASNALLITTLRAVLTDPSPMDAYRQLQQLSGELYGAVGAIEAQRQLDVARVLAYDPDTDIAPLRLAMSTLGDSLRYEDLLPTGPSVSSDSPALTATPLTTFVYVNGINTDPTQANTTIQHYLGPLLAEAGFADRNLYPLRRSYNLSGTLIQNGSTWDCLVQRALAVAVGQWSASHNMLQCFGIVADLGQSLRQLAGQTLVTLPATEDVNHLVQIIRSILAGGSRAVIVAHSQGNLVVADALGVLASGSPAAPLQCVGVVSIAPPHLIQPGSNGATVSSLIVQGQRSKDILLSSLLASGVPTFTNLLSDAWDSYYFLPFDLVNQFISGLQLHDINQSYIVMTGTRAVILQALQTQSANVSQRCPSLAAPSLTISSPLQNGQLPVGSGNVGAVVPVTVSSSAGPLSGSTSISAELFLSAREQFYHTTSRIWSSSAGDFTPAALNSTGSKTVMASVHIPGNLSPTAYYALFGQLAVNGVPIAQAQTPLAGVVTVFPYPLGQVPLSFPDDALHPSIVGPLMQSYLANYGGQILAGVVFGARQASVAFRVGGGQTVASVYNYYDSYLTQRGYAISSRSVSAELASLYGVLGAGLAAVDCNFVVSNQAGSLVVQLTFVRRSKY